MGRAAAGWAARVPGSDGRVPGSDGRVPEPTTDLQDPTKINKESPDSNGAGCRAVLCFRQRPPSRLRAAPGGAQPWWCPWLPGQPPPRVLVPLSCRKKHESESKQKSGLHPKKGRQWPCWAGAVPMSQSRYVRPSPTQKYPAKAPGGARSSLARTSTARFWCTPRQYGCRLMSEAFTLSRQMV